MTINIETVLDSTRHQLRELGNGVANIANSYADVFSAPEIASQFEAFRRAYSEAVNRLNAPNLYIATLGTTSSGKSTIVNALIGRKVAPIEAGEMSGGVLTLRHGEQRSLIVAETEEAAWDVGVWDDLNDEEIYDRIRNHIMIPYHHIRKERECRAPEVTAVGPILPGQDIGLLGLPTGIQVEFIDLPGLKSVKDRTNLAVIQSRVHKAFSIVALDYMQVDDDHRKRLLEELVRVVQYLNGRTDSMVFVLNRVDQRGEDDISVEERIGQLQGEIQKVLSLQELPDVLPFSARLLYYAQCAWGPCSLSESSQVDQVTRSKLLNAMFRDCAALINSKVRGDRSLKNWIRDIQDRVEEGESVNDEEMRQIVRYALEWSGGERLWSRLRARVQDSFPELVLLPALVEVFDSFDALVQAIETLAEIRRLRSKEEIETEQARIRESRDRLHEQVEQIRKKFRKEISQTTEDLKKNDPSTRSRLAQEAKRLGRRGFQSLFDAVDEVEADLTQSLIAPLRDAIKNSEGSYELEEKLGKVISPKLANDLARAYDLTSRKLDSFKLDSDQLSKRVRADDKDGIRELEHAERAIRSLYQGIRNAITVRAEFALQARAQQLEAALQSLVEEQQGQLQEICLQELPSLNLDAAIMSHFKGSTLGRLLTLPGKFFEFPNTLKQQELNQREKVGERKETYTTGSCFKSEETRTVDVTENIQYRELLLPNATGMARQWSEGIAKGKDGLWDVLCKWINDHLDVVMDAFDHSINKVLDLAEHALKEQITIIEKNFEEELQQWNEIEAEKNLVIETRGKLEHLSQTQSL